VLEVNAAEGQRVDAGDLLFRIDDTEISNELSKVLNQAEGTRKRLESLRDSRRSMREQHADQAEEDGIAIENATAALERARREGNSAGANLQIAQEQLRVAQLRRERAQALFDQGVVSEVDLQEIESEAKVAEASREAADAKLQVAEQNVALAERQLQLRRKQADIGVNERGRELTDLAAGIMSLEETEESLRLEEERLRTTLVDLDVRAPVTGMITAILIKNPGEIIERGETWATIAPENVPWIVESFVSNRDAGPLREKIGTRVKLKFDAFSYRDYGAGEGRLLHVAPDAEFNERIGMAYRVEIGLDSLSLKKGRREGKIRLGMTVTTEIVTEEERILMLLFRGLRDRVTYE
jgi:HlyD family type I secretion membrane fusion protein